MSDPEAKRYRRADFQTDQEVRWCPGCGDYAVLAAMQAFLADLDLDREKVVFVSGIGCSSRFPYYMNTYGFHGIHGRAPALASGIALANPGLSVWVVTGDGDALSIGGNHFIHAMRRNLNLKILLFNNQIYGLTKGQYSPTSEPGKRTKSSPTGSIAAPFNPISLALGAEASFVARTVDTDRALTTELLRRAYQHRGTAFIEIYQKCHVFNDEAFVALTGREQRLANRINLRHGQPVVFGPNEEKGVVLLSRGARIVDVAEIGLDAVHVHDEHAPDPAAAFALSRLSHTPQGPTPLGVFREVVRPRYEDQLQRQMRDAQERPGPASLRELIRQTGTWTVSEDSPG